MRVNSTKTALFLAFFAGVAFAKVANVAVIETEVDMQSGAAKEISKSEIREITAELRRQAVNNLPKGRYNVMTEQTVQAQGAAVLQECADENCMVSLGSKIGADYIVRGTISKFQKKFTLSIEIYDTEDGNLIASSNPVRSENLDNLLDESATVSKDMYKVFIGAQSSSSSVPKSNKSVENDKNDKSEKPAKTGEGHFGIFAGVSPSSTLKFTRSDDDGSISGTVSFFAGMVGITFIKPIIKEGVELEIGAAFSMWIENGNGDGDFSISGVDVPVLVRYDFGGPYAGAGVNVGIPLKAGQDDFSPDIKVPEISLAISGGYKFGSFFVGIKYLIPMTDFAEFSESYDDGDEYYSYTTTFKRSGLFVEAGYLF